MNNSHFDKLFDNGKEDILKYLDLNKSKRINNMKDDKCDICNSKLKTDGYIWWCTSKLDTTDGEK